MCDLFMHVCVHTHPYHKECKLIDLMLTLHRDNVADGFWICFIVAILDRGQGILHIVWAIMFTVFFRLHISASKVFNLFFSPYFSGVRISHYYMIVS